MVGTMLGPYRIAEPIGAGGMGEVYRAHDSRLQRDVAVKLLPAARAGDDQARARLLSEARAAAALNHPHICTIYEVGDADGHAFIAMELVDGKPLDHVIPTGGLQPRAAVDYAQQIAQAVAHAHAKGVLHRDLKTSNIMVTSEGRVKVLDFGIAKRLREHAPDLTTDAHTVSEPGRITGTLAYLSPEQLRGEPASAASDVWALGVVLHELAAGERPFDGKTAFEVASAILEQPPRPLPTTAPPELATVIPKCLAKDPQQRYRNAAELRSALDAAASARDWTARDAPAKRTRWRTVAIAASAALIIAAAAFVGRVGLRAPSGGGAPPRVASIAVLPLDNLSGKPEEEHFAVGIQDGLIAELAHVRALERVIERRSTRRFAGSTQPVSEIAKALGVDAIVTGSVLRSGDRIQVTAQLIDAKTERLVWTDRFERDARDMLSIQTDVVTAVAGALGIEPTDAERRRRGQRKQIDPATYEAYLRGMHLVTRGTGDRAERLRGMAILQEAVDRDPGNAHAYAGLALGYVALGHGPHADAEAWPKARAAALRAVTLDPELAEAHSALAEVRVYHDRDWAGAEQSFRRANELNPNIAMNHYHYSWFLVLFSRWQEAIAEHKRAQELDPLTPVHTANLGAVYLYRGDRSRGDLDLAVAEAKKAIEFAPKGPAGYGVAARALSDKGERAEAEALMRKAVELNPALTEFELGVLLAEHGKIDDARAILAKLERQPPTPWCIWSLSQLSVALGDYDNAFKWLNYRPAHAFLPWIRVNPGYKPIRKDPRFVKLLADLRLPPAE